MSEEAKLKLKLVEEQNKIPSIEKQITAKRGEVSSLENTLEGVNELLPSRINRAKNLAMESHRDSYLSPAQREVDHAVVNYKSARSEYLSSVKSLSLNEFKDKVASSSNVSKLEEVLEKTIVLIRNRLSDSVVDDIIASTEVKYIDASPENLKKVESYFKKRLEYLMKKGNLLSSDKDYLQGFINKGLLYVQESSSKRSAILTGAIAMVMSMPVITPFYVPYVLYTSFKDLNNLKIYRDVLNDYILIKNNLEYIKSMEENLAIEMYNSAIDSVYSESSAQLDEFKKLYETAYEDLQFKKSTVESYFQFDETSIRIEHENEVAGLKRKIDILQGEIDTLIDVRKSALENIDKYKSAVSSAFESKKEDFYKPKCDSLLMPKEIIYDITDTRVEALPYRAGQTIIFGEQLEVTMSFVNLLIFQLKNILDPMVYTIEVWDNVHLGSFQSMFKGESERVDLKDSEEDIKESLDLCLRLSKQRRDYLSTDFETLYEYNLEMLELGSSPESYRIVILIIPDANLLTKNEFKSLWAVGKKCGIYFFIVILTEETPGELVSFIKSSDNIYLVEEIRIIKLAQSKALQYVEVNS